MKPNVFILHRTQGKGVEAVHLLGIAKGFEHGGYACHFISPPGVEVTANEGKRGKANLVAKYAPQVFFELLEIASNWSIGRRLRKEKKGLGCDLVYERYAFLGWTGLIHARKWGVPHALEVNYISADDLELRRRTNLFMPLVRRIEKFVFAHSTLLLPVSSFLAQELRQMGIPENKILVSPNAVDLDIFDRRCDVEMLRKSLSLRKGPVIGFVGSFARWHGVDSLIEACINLSEKYRELNLLLIGDGIMRESMERRLGQIASLRAVFTGRVNHDDVCKYVQLMDVAVMPNSNTYGSPMKVFEYMAMGKAVIAPDYMPLQDAIRNGDDGLLFSPTKGDLEMTLDRVLGDEKMRKALGSKARERVIREHNWPSRVQTILSKLESLRST